MKYSFEIYIPGINYPKSAKALEKALIGLDPNMSYSQMMRMRASGKASAECTDVYYLCCDGDDNLISRLWMGWGKHENSVGNWGNFFTSPKHRGQGIGRKMLDMWQADLSERHDLPTALFCTAGDEGLVRLYAPYGFRPALKNATCGPLYCPLGDSPESFEDFCREYYKPAKSIEFKPATLEWRHEIDCLYKFAMLDVGLEYLPHGMSSLESALLENDINAEIIFTDANIPVGLASINKDGKKSITVHPNYIHLI